MMFRRCAASVIVMTLTFAHAAHAQTDPKVEACIADAGAGQALRRADKLLDARATFGRCSAVECPTAIREQCTQWRAEVEAEVAALRVRVLDGAGLEVADARVEVDERVVTSWPLAVDPGPHAVRATRDGRTSAVQSIVVKRGENALVQIVVPPAAATTAEQDAPRERPVSPVWIGVGLSAAALVGGVAMAVSAKDQVDDMRERCAPECSLREVREAKTTAFFADTLLVVGGVGMVVSTVLLLVARPSPSPSPRPHARR